MRTFRHPPFLLKNHKLDHRSLYLVSLMIFFWCIFDGIVAFMSPLVITNAGFSKAAMGLIISCSSLTGAVFDFLLSKFLRNAQFRRSYLFMFAISFAVPFLLWQANTLFVFLAAMALWGIYFDFQNFGNFEFVTMMTKEEEHASSFGALSVFRSCGYLIAPILLGFVLSGLSFLPFILAWFFLIVSFFVFLFLLKTAGKGENKAEKSMVKKSRLLPEFTLWRRVGKLLFPFLFLMTIMHIYNAVFWTIGPIFSESFPGLGNFSGIFLAAFLFSPLIFGWLVGPAVKVLGKRNSVIFCFLAGSLLLSLFSLFSNLYFLIALIFVSSGLVTIAWSSINGIFSDYLSESVVLDGEIEGLADFFTNLGYIIGPALAGFLAEKVGSGNAFTVIGLLGFSATLLVFLFLPKRIRFVEPSLLKA